MASETVRGGIWINILLGRVTLVCETRVPRQYQRAETENAIALNQYFTSPKPGQGSSCVKFLSDSRCATTGFSLYYVDSCTLYYG